MGLAHSLGALTANFRRCYKTSKFANQAKLHLDNLSHFSTFTQYGIFSIYIISNAVFYTFYTYDDTGTFLRYNVHFI